MTHTVESYAYRYLENCGAPTLPIGFDRLADWCKSEGYRVMFYREREARDIIEVYNLQEYTRSKLAFTVSTEKIRIIFLSDSSSYAERCFALAHELGHIYLRHTNQEILGKAIDDQALENAQEEEADSFAVCLLAPLCILKKYNILSTTEVEKIAGLPKEWAQKAVIGALERKDSYLPIEKLLIQDFAHLQQEDPPQIIRKKNPPEPEKEHGFWTDRWYLILIIGFAFIAAGGYLLWRTLTLW